MDDELLIADDGILAPVIGDWGEEKYKLISYYSRLFAVGMSKLWKNRVYIDLYAGAGRAKIRNTERFVDTSAVLAYKPDIPFTHYIFSDMCERRLEALQTRVLKIAKPAQVKFIQGDVNSTIKSIISHIPQHSRGNNVLSFCVVDPFNMNAFAFKTIEALSSKIVDFLVLIPSFMDGNRNLKYYLPTSSTQVESFLGDPNWRIEWAKTPSQSAPSSFGYFVLKQFCKRMEALGYLDGCKDAVLIKSDKGIPLYHLAFFSKSPKGMEFWKKTKDGTSPQQDFLSTLG